MPDNDPSAIVIPFGKHRGSTVAELLAKDPAYAEWLAAQGWLAQRFAELHAAILARGAGADDSPEHNRIQIRFLDPLFRAAIISLTQNVQETRISDWNNRAWDLKETVRKLPSAITHAQERIKINQEMLANSSSAGFAGGMPASYRNAQLAQAEQELLAKRAELADAQAKLATFPHLPLLSIVAFEQRGVDARINWGFLETISDYHPDRFFNVEIKPTLGDDYPSVMRQMQRLQCQILLIETYTGLGVPLPLLRQMFTANSTQLITLADAEAEIPNARQLLA